MGYRAEPEALHHAERSAQSAGEQAGRVRIADPVQDIAEALPGGKSEGASAKVAQSWQRALAKWSEDATAHGKSLADAGKTYERTDSGSAESISATGR
ncbi:hypothetical protein [Saccharopolyspora tripterygii]